MDTLDVLTFSLQANRGAYALLLGSGVSRAAQVPTGWEVVEDLIRKLAQVQGKTADPDPAAWYRGSTGEEPSYSSLLRALAPSPLERQSLLKRYFEPSAEDREAGRKLPTKAHQAIAQLVARGYIRIILTTNFDRLLESALEQVGIAPIVVSSSGQLDGLPPLVHINSLIVKLHGDYLDIRIRNTPEELARYDKKIARLLARVLDEYGLIVCGWSAQWDEALCSALERCRTRRFPTFWTHRGHAAPRAQQLISLRQAHTIEIADADSFFDSLSERAAALADYERPHPLSVKLLVTSLKSYLAEERHRIRLRDLVHEETERAYAQLFAPEQFPLDGTAYSPETVLERLRRYEALTDRLEALLTIGCFWSADHQRSLWSEVLGRIGSPPAPILPYSTAWNELRWYPLLRLLYAGSLAALAKANYRTVRSLVEVRTVRSSSQEPEPLSMCVWAVMGVINDSTLNKALGKRDRVPVSEYLFTGLRERLMEFVPSDGEYDRLFDRFEYLYALDFLDRKNDEYWIPIGRFSYRFTSPRSVVQTIHREIEQQGSAWEPLQQEFFAGSLERAKNAEERALAFLNQHRSQLTW